jgi:hypothetical protein
MMRFLRWKRSPKETGRVLVLENYQTRVEWSDFAGRNLIGQLETPLERGDRVMCQRNGKTASFLVLESAKHPNYFTAVTDEGRYLQDQSPVT